MAQNIKKITKALSGAGDPIVLGIVPEFLGQVYFDTLNTEGFVAHGLTSTSWNQIAQDNKLSLVDNRVDILELSTHPKDQDLFLDKGNPNEVSASDLRLHLDRVKEIFFSGNISDIFGAYAVSNVAQSGDTNITFSVPLDFNSIVALDLIFVPDASIIPPQTVDINSDYGAIGESFQKHQESLLLQPITGALGDIETLDISGIYTVLSAGDFAGFNIILNGIGTSINVLGIRLRYT